MKKYYKKFTSKKEMIEQLSSLTDKFDTEAMIEALPKSGPRRIFLVTAEGKQIACDNFKKFISILTTQGGLDFLYPICFGRGEIYHVYSRTDYFKTESEKKVDVVVEATLKPVEGTEQPELPEVIVEVSEKLSEVVETAEDSSKVDWEKIWSMKDDNSKRQSKDDLEKYCKTEFGVDLNKKSKFDDMVKELETFLKK